MKKLWLRWYGGLETRDDGFTIYHDPRFAMLRYPDGRMEKHPTAEAAKRAVEKEENRAIHTRGTIENH